MHDPTQILEDDARLNQLVARHVMEWSDAVSDVFDWDFARRVGHAWFALEHVRGRYPGLHVRISDRDDHWVCELSGTSVRSDDPMPVARSDTAARAISLAILKFCLLRCSDHDRSDHRPVSS